MWSEGAECFFEVHWPKFATLTWAHRGGLTFARAKIAFGTCQTESPAINAEATTGANWRAVAGARYCQIARMTEPMAMSTVKNAPTKEGMPSMLGIGTSLTQTDSDPNLQGSFLFKYIYSDTSKGIITKLHHIGIMHAPRRAGCVVAIRKASSLIQGGQKNEGGEGGWMSLQQRITHLWERYSRIKLSTIAKPNAPPASPRQCFGKSLDPFMATTAMLRQTAANGALYSPSGLPMLYLRRCIAESPYSRMLDLSTDSTDIGNILVNL